VLSILLSAHGSVARRLGELAGLDGVDELLQVGGIAARKGHRG